MITFLCADRPFVVQRAPQRINHTAEQFFAHGNVHDTPCTVNAVARFDAVRRCQEHNADVLFRQGKGHAHHTVRKTQQFLHLNVFKARDFGRTAGNGTDCADFLDVQTGV